MQSVQILSRPPDGGYLRMWAEDGLRLVCVVFDPRSEDFYCYLEELA